MWKMGIHLSET